MCALLQMASLALQIAGTVGEFKQAKANAKAHNEMSQRNYKATMQTYRDNHAALGLQNLQQWEATQQESEENSLKTRPTAATAKVTAGESGIRGNTVDALFREISGNGERNQSSIYTNYLRANAAIGDRMRVDRDQTAGIVSGLAPVNKPSGALAALKIGSAAMNSYSGYKSGSFGNDGNQWRTLH
jgi:hypothetical protein